MIRVVSLLFNLETVIAPVNRTEEANRKVSNWRPCETVDGATEWVSYYPGKRDFGIVYPKVKNVAVTDAETNKTHKSVITLEQEKTRVFTGSGLAIMSVQQSMITFHHHTVFTSRQ